jgi:hypothetical protein
MLPLDAFDLSPAEVEHRFAWAVRQGNRSWLWPDTPIAGWRSALLQIERITREILHDGRADTALTESGDRLCVAAFTSGMGPLLGYWGAVGKLRASAEVLALVDLHYRHNAIRMDMLSARAAEAVGARAGAGVRATVLKGMQTAFAYFPTPGTRPLSDIDLLVDAADRALAGEVLHCLGYLPGKTVLFPPQQCWRMASSPPVPRSLVLTHRDGPWYIDLHTGLSQRYSAGARIVELDRLRAPGRIESWVLSLSADALAPVAMLLHLACHASCGLEA